MLSQHIDMSRIVAQYIIEGSSPRVRCQRIINVLLVNLDSIRDYMQFCFQLDTISLLTDLPCKMITGKLLVKGYNPKKLEDF